MRHFCAGITGIDIFGELYNARNFHYMELGRWDYSLRVGFVDLMRKSKWGIEVGGASRYRKSRGEEIPDWAQECIDAEGQRP